VSVEGVMLSWVPQRDINERQCERIISIHYRVGGLSRLQQRPSLSLRSSVAMANNEMVYLGNRNLPISADDSS